MPVRDDATSLRHMLDASRKAIGFIANRSRSDLRSDELLVLALIRLLEIVGEAANRTAAATRERYSGIPWAQVIGMRNRLIHGYDVIDLDVLWQTVVDDLPTLINELEKITSAG